MGFFPETWAVLGMLGDKDVAGVVRLLRDRVDHWLLTSLPGPRGLSAARLAEILRELGVSGDVSEHDSPRAAYQVARDGAAEGDRIVIFGSFLTVADVLAAVKAPQ
jgi:dihydrofolate synthase/folylpolyglutamate synthase